MRKVTSQPALGGGVTGAGDGSECISDSWVVFGECLKLDSGFVDRSKGLNVFVAWQFLFGRDVLGQLVFGQKNDG